MTDIVVNGVAYNGVEAIAMKDTSGETVVFYPKVGYLVVFMGCGGTSSVFYTYTDANGKLAELPTATREDYTFLGWYTAEEGGTQVTTDTVFTADTLLYAQWKDNAATITVTGSGSYLGTVYDHIVINGEQISTAGTYKVEPGTEITVKATTVTVTSGSSSSTMSAYIYLNGTVVAQKTNKGQTASYTYTVTGPITIDMSISAFTGGNKVTITEE